MFHGNAPECLIEYKREFGAGSLSAERADRGQRIMDYEKIDVVCHSGYRANERPVAFVHQGRGWEVREIIDRWCEGSLDSTRPGINYFKVRTQEGRVFLLRYLSLFDAWSVHVP